MFVFLTNGFYPSGVKRAQVIIVLILILGSLLLVSPEKAFSYPVPPLPEDNLITNPWFRSASDPRVAGLDGWTNVLQDGVGWDLSQKETNPSPEIVVSGVCGFKEVYCGTGARWANETIGKELFSHPGVDAMMYQVLKANPSHRKLTFFMYWVNHKLDVFEVKIYGAATADGPWMDVWEPFFLTQEVNPPPGDAPGRGNIPWFNTGFLEAVFEEGYPFYKIELHARYPEAGNNHGDVGVKVTGVYFATESTDAQADTSPAALILEGTWSGSSGETTQPENQLTPSIKPDRTRVPTLTGADSSSPTAEPTSIPPTSVPTQIPTESIQATKTSRPTRTPPPSNPAPTSGEIPGLMAGVFLFGVILVGAFWLVMTRQKPK